jgi:glucose dehydrogenase
MLGLSSWLAGTVLDVWHVSPRALMACLSGLLLLTAAVWRLLGPGGAPAPAALRAPPP